MHRRYMKEMKVVVRTITGETSPYFLPIWVEAPAHFPTIIEAQQDFANMLCHTRALRLNRATAINCQTFEQVDDVSAHWINPTHIWQWECGWSGDGKHIAIDVPEDVATMLTRQPTGEDTRH